MCLNSKLLQNTRLALSFQEAAASFVLAPGPNTSPEYLCEAGILVWLQDIDDKRVREAAKPDTGDIIAGRVGGESRHPAFPSAHLRKSRSHLDTIKLLNSGFL